MTAAEAWESLAKKRLQWDEESWAAVPEECKQIVRDLTAIKSRLADLACKDLCELSESWRIDVNGLKERLKDRALKLPPELGG